MKYVCPLCGDIFYRSKVAKSLMYCTNACRLDSTYSIAYQIKLLKSIGADDRTIFVHLARHNELEHKKHLAIAFVDYFLETQLLKDNTNFSGYIGTLIQKYNL